MCMATFDPKVWAAVPFHFWSVIFFVLGSMVGSFLNVCIYRMPIGESIVSPPSHCPHCRYSIPWYLNIPLVTWICLRGKCANCGAPISVRYFAVELLTGLVFLGCWLSFGALSAPLALVYCLLLSGLIVATFIDMEHFIIPDEITLGGIAVGFFCSLGVPMLHEVKTSVLSLQQSFLGIAVGGGLVYGILRLAKVFFGKEKFTLPPDTRVVFGESGLQLPDRQVAYDEVFYRKSDTISLHAKSVKIGERVWENVAVQLNPTLLKVGEETFNPSEVTQMEVVTDQMILPREAMGLGDVKFMAAIGAFLGWQATLFSLMLSSIIGAFIGVGLILIRRKEWSSRIPYGPYIAVAAAVWIFIGRDWVKWWFAF